jgi:hypothetical protein
LGFAEVEAGNLEAVEEEAGAAWVDVVGGDALQDLADGGLDGGAVFGEMEVKGGAATATLTWVGYRLAAGVVVVAEFFLAEAWAGAAASVGEDVAALVLFGCFRCVLHVVSPHGCFFVQSLRKRRDKSGLAWARVLFSRLNAKVRLFGRASFSIYFYFNEVSETKMPSSASLFFGRRWLIWG